MTNRENIEASDNREFARFLASVAGYGGNKEEVDFWEHWLMLNLDRTRMINTALDVAIKALEQTRWIPVSERLPNTEEYIANNGLFIVTDGNRTYVKYFDVYDSMMYFGEPTMNGFRVDRCVIAWSPSPLPQPYKEGNDDK